MLPARRDRAGFDAAILQRAFGGIVAREPQVSQSRQLASRYGW
jgi:hypothetical protein